MNKETLLERCQREAREMYKEATRYRESMDDDIEDIVANTLKQATEALEGMKKQDLPSSLKDPAGFCSGIGYNQALTDAQRLLGCENENV